MWEISPLTPMELIWAVFKTKNLATACLNHSNVIRMDERNVTMVR